MYFLKHESDVFELFKKWLAQVENELGWKLKCLKSDNGTKYCDGRLEGFCTSRGIRRVKTVLENPHQNGVTKCMNRTILKRAQSIRIHASLPKQFWANAVNTMVYLINKGPSVPLNCGISRETWTDKEVNLNHLRTFCCISLLAQRPSTLVLMMINSCSYSLLIIL